MSERSVDDKAHIYLVGGGIASLAAAAFFIRDGDVLGRDITILEESGKIGGSLDAAGNPKDGYTMRGGRMIESKYVCTYDLFFSIPTLDESKTVTKEIVDWNETMKTSSRSRLFRDGHRIDAPQFGLSERHILTIERLVVEPEKMLGRRSIEEEFEPSFFETDFWLMWCTTFAFQPWHSAVEFKRYLARFTHMVSGFNTLTGIMRTVYNQYDSMVRPLEKWLGERGVKFELNSRVTDLSFLHDIHGYIPERLVVERNGASEEILVTEKDKVIITLGSMTESSSLGSMDAAPVLAGKSDGGSWALWEKIAGVRGSSVARRILPIISTNPSGFRSPRLFTTQLFSISSGMPPVTCRARAVSLPSRNPVGSHRLCCRTNRILLVRQRTFRFFGGTDSSSINRATL